MQILRVNNLSADAFRLIPPAFASNMLDMPPASIWKWASQERADLALVPVARLLDVSKCMEPIGHYGIACTGRVRSVLLLTNAPLKTLATRPTTIFLSEDSVTSNRLLKILWRRSCDSQLRLCNDLTVADGALAIGNAALLSAGVHRRWSAQIDLCEWWFQLTGLPFVFARWCIHRRATAKVRADVLAWLDACSAHANSPAGLKQLAEGAVKGGLFSAEVDAKGYFAALTNKFGHRECVGEAKFLSFMSESIDEPGTYHKG